MLFKLPDRLISVVLVSLLTLVSSGCGRSTDQESEPTVSSPRPVRVLLVQRGMERTCKTVSATVSAWKQEQIGFQVAGRVRHVIEPGTEVDGRLFDSSGQQLTEGTVLAQLMDDRYAIAVQSAEAAVNVATRRMEAVDVDIATGFPARLQAQKADRELAEIEYQRNVQLDNNNAVSAAALDRSRTLVATAKAAEATTRATLEARKAELRSLQADVERARSDLASAQVDLRDTRLFSSFRGQVAEIHVAPGSYVASGDPVATVQMMDPIKVEFEVSSEDTHRFRHGDTLRVQVSTERGPVELPGFVLLTDPVADSRSRTFTVSLLVRNERTHLEVPPNMQGSVVARTDEVWPVHIEQILGAGRKHMIEEHAVREDANGRFLWRVLNRRVDQVSQTSRILDVVRVPVKVGQQRVPFLTWQFVPVQFGPDIEFEPDAALFAGDLRVEGQSANEWAGTQILFDVSGWMLRPGDTVLVEQTAPKNGSAHYIPAKAIRHEAGRSYIYLADRERGAARAVRQEIRVSTQDRSEHQGNTVLAIEAVSEEELPETLSLIVEGVHFLEDGDPIVVSQERQQ